MRKKPRCIWCQRPVAHRGDTCNKECYVGICAVLARGIPYIKEEDDAPNTATDQPWYVDPRKDNE